MGFLIFLLQRIRMQMGVLQLARLGQMASLGLGQIAEQFSRIGICHPRGGAQVKLMGRIFHIGDFIADALNPEIFDQPDRPPGVVASNMFTPYQWNLIAKPHLVQIDQTLPVQPLLLRHALKQCSTGGKFIAHLIGVALVDSCIVLFRRDGKRQHFLF